MDMDKKTIAFLANEITRAYMTGKNIGSQEEFAREYFKMYQKSIKIISAEVNYKGTTSLDDIKNHPERYTRR